VNIPSGRRLFLLALVVSLTATALLAIGILLVAEFDDTTWRILGTTALIGLFSLLSLPAGALLDRDEARLLAYATIGAAASGLVLTLVLLWGELESDAAAKAAVTIALLAGALAQTAATTSRRRSTDTGAVSALYVGAAGSAFGLAAMGAIAAWGEIEDSPYYRFLGALAVADLLLVLLQPAVRRMSSPAERAAPFRLVLTLDRAPSDEEVATAVTALEGHGLKVENVDRRG
jgi:hypothetical protein